MFLQRLNEYGRRAEDKKTEDNEKPLPTLYSVRPVRYVIYLDADGRLLSPEPVDTASGAKGRARFGSPLPVPYVTPSSNIQPLPFASDAEYTFGLARPNSRGNRPEERHRAYLAQIERYARSCPEAGVQAVSRFLAKDPLESLRLPESFDPSARITFRVVGQWVVELASVQALWAQDNRPDADPKHSGRAMDCLVCGRRGPTLRVLKTKVKGLPGAPPGGTALVSANCPAFESYGLTQSFIAPTCTSCGERAVRALNHLLSSGHHCLKVGNAALICWALEDQAFNPLAWLDSPDPVRVLELMDAISTGRGTADIDPTPFYAAILSDRGRVVVRDWLDTTVGNVKNHVAQWFGRQSVVGPSGKEAKPIGLTELTAAVFRHAEKTGESARVATNGSGNRSVSPFADPSAAAVVLGALWRAAFTGQPLPHTLLTKAVQRARVLEYGRDRIALPRVTHARAALIKAVLWDSNHSSRGVGQEDIMVRLDPERTDPAYNCGRLLAVIEDAQRRALGDINTSVTDRFYGTASTAPATVYGRLLQGVRPHLATLERDNRGAFYALQQKIETIMAHLEAFPRVLNLEEQGLFALGYYHQRAADRAGAHQGKERQHLADAEGKVGQGMLIPEDADEQQHDDEEDVP